MKYFNLIQQCALGWLFALSLSGCARDAGRPETTPKDVGAAPTPLQGEPARWQATPSHRLEGFSTPESVAYDKQSDSYLVSNINGHPAALDNNGFISKISGDCAATTLHFIDATTSAPLNAPKGMTIQGDRLYVTDIDSVRIYSLPAGRYERSVTIPEATFLNDIAVDEQGTIYVTDTGLRAAPGGLEDSGTDSIWKISQGRATRLLAAPSAKKPNGLALVSGRLLVASSPGAVFWLDASGHSAPPVTLPGTDLDGIGLLDANTVLVSSWAAKAVFVGAAAGPYVPLIEGVASPADFVYQPDRRRLLIPLFLGNAVAVYDIDRR